MGTSMPYLKPTKRYLFPSSRYDVDENLSFLLGGNCVCAILAGDNEALVINRSPTREYREWIDARAPSAELKFVFCSDALKTAPSDSRILQPTEETVLQIA